jgi:hypothetical protein
VDAGMLTAAARQRQDNPKRMSQSLRADLDWIVMRCLEKDRARRYPTANSLADDIQRYLDDEPVQARRPTRTYRMRKFARRHKVGVLAGVSIAAAVLLGLTLASLGLVQARRQAEIARTQARIASTQAIRSEQVALFLKEMLEGVEPSVAQGRDTTLMREILDKTARRIRTEGTTRN